jgi:hypothetical protein
VSPSRGRRMPPPLASNPHRFHEDRSEIAQDLVELARRPLRPALPTEWVGTPDLGEDDFDDVAAEPRCSLARPADASAAGIRPAGKCAGLRQTLAMADKLTVTVERIDGGKFRCTGATWSDAVVIYPGEALGPCGHRAPGAALRAKAPSVQDGRGRPRSPWSAGVI